MPVIFYGLNAKALTAGAKKVKNELAGIVKRANITGASLGKMFNPLSASLAGLGGGFGAVKLAQIGDEYTNMAAQLEYLTGSAENAEQAQELLYKMSQKTGTSMTNNAKALTRFQLASEMTGLSTEENVEALGAINVLLAKTGVSTQEASAGMIQLGQALASGRLQGDEFRSISENMPALMNEMAKSLGVTRHELKLMSTEGKLTSDVVAQTFVQMASSANGAESELPLTVGRMWEKVVNATQKMWDKINDQTGILAWFATGLDNLSIWVDENIPVVVGFFQQVKDKAVEMWPYLKAFFTEFVSLGGQLVTYVKNSWPEIKLFFVGLWDLGKSVLDLFMVFFPYVQKGILNLISYVDWAIPKLKTLIEWATKAINAGQTALSYTPIAVAANAIKESDGEGFLGTVGNVISDIFDPSEYGNTGETTPVASGSGGGDININVNQKVSKSDVVGIATETQRMNSRG